MSSSGLNSPGSGQAAPNSNLGSRLRKPVPPQPSLPAAVSSSSSSFNNSNSAYGNYYSKSVVAAGGNVAQGVVNDKSKGSDEIDNLLQFGHDQEAGRGPNFEKFNTASDDDEDDDDDVGNLERQQRRYDKARVQSSRELVVGVTYRFMINFKRFLNSLALLSTCVDNNVPTRRSWRGWLKRLIAALSAIATICTFFVMFRTSAGGGEYKSNGGDGNVTFTGGKGEVKSHLNSAKVLPPLDDLEPHPAGRVNYATLKNLVITPCHATLSFKDCSSFEDFLTDECWALLPYQLNSGLPQAAVGHVKKSIELANEDVSSLLVFSGGQTRAVSGGIAEGSSYYILADVLNLWGSGSVRERSITEDHARDSMENLINSICRFKQITGAYPEVIKVVGFTFKRDRFVHLHRRSVRWPEEKFFYYGLDPSSDTGFSLSKSAAGEYRNSYLPFTSDPYGCSPFLAGKKAGRDPFKRGGIEHCDDMMELITFCGGHVFDGVLPWD